MCIHTNTHHFLQAECLFFTLSEDSAVSTTTVRVCVCVHLIVQSCLTLCDPMDCSTPGFPVLHYLRVCSNLRPFSLGGYPTISSSVAPFWSRLPFPPPENLPDKGSKIPGLLRWWVDSLPLNHWEAQHYFTTSHCDFQFFDWQE